MELGEYDHRAVEAAARDLWEAHDIYRYDRDGDRPVFSVDTPPPTYPRRTCTSVTR